MSDPTFTTHGDEPVEARIVCWVLGEASAFEAAELERLCEAQPELMIFKRRIEAVHGLLGQAVKPSQDRSWTLSPRRRLAIEKLICDDDRSEIDRAREQARDQRIRHSGRRAGWAIAACVLLAIVALALLDPFDLIIHRQRAVKEVPMIIAYSADVAEDLVADASKKVPLRTEFPPELIEGTPKPIQVPNLEENRSGPAGGSQMFFNAQEAQASDEKRDESVGREVTAQAPSKPKSPSASMARVIASNTVAPAAIPVPSEEVGMETLKFGDAKDFSQNWGADKDAHAFSSPGVDPFAAPSAEPPAEGASALAAKPPVVVEEVQYAGRLSRFRASAGGKAKETKGNEGAEFKGQLAEQEARVEASRRDLAAIVRTKGIIYDGVDEDQAEGALGKSRENQELLKAKEKFEREQKILEGWKKVTIAGNAIAEPKPLPPVDPGEEIAAAQEPYSTFSLNISDASFRIAQAALAKGEQPDPQGIRVEQFYNAVNYGDPAPAAGQPVAGTVEQAAHPVVPGRNLVRVAIKTAAAGRSPQQALHLTLLVDQSGSMVREDRREAMEQALKGLGDLLTPQDVVHVIGFARTPHLLAEGLQGDRAKRLVDLIHMEANEGGTNLEEAMKLAEELAKRHQQQGAQNRVVLFTDGAANLGDADPESLAKKVEQLRQGGIAFDIAGIAADGINDELLAELARKGNGRYYIVGKGESDQLAKQLAGAFNPAAENVKVQVRFNPARVGGYKLVGFEKDRLRKEDFRNDQVDAAEMAAEEAGVAIYQVEPLADGDGEIGEVSVRFRDTATGGMVERSWTIPYDASAPGMEQASASMQLAVMSMLAGEKLRGGPLADAIDFKSLGKVRAALRQHYGSDRRIAEMLQMIDQLK